MSKNHIKNKILVIKNLMKQIKGTPCEVYSRVVGYLRPVQRWNDGKKTEFNMRKIFDVSKEKTQKS
ncbi:MAG: hypothetical protein IKL48_00205 [Elusimicrobiaceae bacterium]|nr:hypothetical protein [Elusimicrobiaceae bacterium]